MPSENSNIQLENGGELQISLYLSCEDQIATILRKIFEKNLINDFV